MQRVLRLQSRLAFRQVQSDESGLPLAEWFPARQASQQLAVSRRVQEPVPWTLAALWPRALSARPAWPSAQREPQVRSVSLLQARRWLPEGSQVQEAASAQPSRLHPWHLSPLWQPLPVALPLPLLPESSCELSQRRPQGSSSSASSFP